MPNMLAIVSKAVFEKEARNTQGAILNVGECYPTDRYRSTSSFLQPLSEGGAIFLVTVRPGGQLWLVGVLEYPKFKDDAWIAAGPNQVPITDISSIISQLQFASGKGIQCEPGKLGMTLQTPRVLTDEDVLLLRRATGQIPKVAASNKHPKVPTKPVPTIPPEKLKTLERILRVSSRVKIDDMAAVLGTSRADLILKLLDFADQYHFKIEEDLIVFETTAGAGDFIKNLEIQFDAWSRSSEKARDS